MRYVAIDFETANSDAISACSVGLARMEDGQLLDSWYSLIKPPSLYFAAGNIAIHGIQPKDVVAKPDFSQVWPEILLFIGDDVLIAHNAPFDIGILRSLLHYYELPVPSLRYTCTVKIARKVWPQLPSHRLSYLCQHFGFSYQAHHALHDAVNCALVFHKACPLRTEGEVISFLLEKGIRFQRIHDG